jgi:signal transduction histidine kinase
VQTAQQLLSPRVVTGFPEQRLSDLSGEIDRVYAQTCVILEPASLRAIGLVRFGDVAAHTALTSRILIDLMRPPPAHQLREGDPAEAAAGVFEIFGPQEIAVLSPTGEYVGLITPESFATWLLENERTRKAELEQLIAEQKRLVDFLENKVRNRMAEIGNALNQFSEASLTLSHDIRGPLVSIRGFAELLVRGEGGELNADGQQAARRIQSSATKLELMANTLLEDARRRFGGATRKFSVVDLNEVAADAVEFLDAQIRDRQARVTLRNRLHSIDGFYVPTLQIFVNVMSNAMKFVARGDAPLIEIWTEETPGGIVLFFKDNGPGIPEEHREKLFQRFAPRLHPDIPGTGLGLAITRNAVTELGGQINLHSEAGKGTVFVLTLQRSRAPEEEVDPPGAEPG